MYCEDEVIERALNHNAVVHSNAVIGTINSTADTDTKNSNTAAEYQPDVQSDSDHETTEQLDAVQSTAPQVQHTPVTPVNQSPAQIQSRGAPSMTRVTPVKVSTPRPAAGHVPVVVPKKAISRPTPPVTATVVNMTPQQKQIQLKLAPVQIVPYEGGKALKFPYDPIEWPKTPKQYILEWFQRQSALRVNKQLALIDPQRAAAMSQVPKWEKVPAPALRQGLHLVTLHVTDSRTLQALSFTPDRYWRYELRAIFRPATDQSRDSTIKEAEHVASLLFLQYLLPQANSAKEIHEAMENMQRHQKRLNSTSAGQ